MDDEVKEDPAKPTRVRSTDKAGWLKKSTGKFLGSYKERYIQLDRTEIAVYENEELKNCVERIDLENFDKCHELRSPFKKKTRLILIGSPKSGSKVGDVKFQAQNQEEKDAWIKALSDGINRAKNKIFDEVKVDEGLSLEHVTRSRPKGNRGRRPPTRIHMKEAANVSSDGILRMDLDAVDRTPNGTHFVSTEGSETAKSQETPSKSMNDIPEEAASEGSPSQKKTLKPPMPPSKENKPSESQESEAPQKKVLKPPMPPSKDKKPSEIIEEEPGEVMQEKKVLKPPMPPSKDAKPTISVNGDGTQENASDGGGECGEAPTANETSPTPEESDEADDAESCEPTPLVTTNSTNPPIPPSKDKKPTKELTEKEGLSEGDDKGLPEIDNKEDKECEVGEKDGEDVKAINPDSEKTDEDEGGLKIEDKAFTLSNNAPKSQGVSWDSPSTDDNLVKEDATKPAVLDTTQSVEDKSSELVKSTSEVKSTPNSTPEIVKKGPPAPPKKKPMKPPIKSADTALESGPVVSSLPNTVTNPVSEKEAVPQNDMKPDTQETKDERKVFVLSISSPGAGEELDNISGAEVEVEEKSIDSGQLSAEDSENGDQVTSSTDKLEGSLQGLDGETSEEDLESSDSKTPPSVDKPSPEILPLTSKTTVENSSANPPQTTCPTTELSGSASVPSSKSKSASTGNLVDLQATPQGSDMNNLQSQVSVELEETVKLLGEIGPCSEGGSNPEDLLATAMEKLRKADQFLKEAAGYKELQNKSNRTSW
ncbi:nucleolar protein dao-5 [Hoplias malabaricus]|uniref:nucleolar protein dao-5 n=1 Tax=Hoplias malabaricus TaxID=27720 RepID=UPI0034618670